jgi:predicted phosphoribosyltransferase
MQRVYADRREAGRMLGRYLGIYAARPDVLVLGLPRGGVPVAFEVARALDAPLDVFIVRKLGVPGHEELAMGAIASGGARVLNYDVVDELEIPDGVVDEVAVREERELRRREELFRGARPALEVAGRVVILVDDGLATGSSMRAAILSLLQLAPERIVVAVPVAPRETAARLAREVDELVCPVLPEVFFAVGSWYADFTQTEDEEVRRLLGERRHEHAGERAAPI